jgi:hypothetical protein
MGDMREQLKAIANRVEALSVREETDGGTVCAQYAQRECVKQLRALAALTAALQEPEA